MYGTRVRESPGRNIVLGSKLIPHAHRARGGGYPCLLEVSSDTAPIAENQTSVRTDAVS
jgi:hypothetical protein